MVESSRALRNCALAQVFFCCFFLFGFFFDVLFFCMALCC